MLPELAASGDENDRAFRGVDVGKAGYGIGEPGPTSKHGHRWLPRDAAPGVSHTHGGSLVAGVYEVDALVDGGIAQGKDGVTHQGEYTLDTLQLEDSGVYDVQVFLWDSMASPTPLTSGVDTLEIEISK